MFKKINFLKNSNFDDMASKWWDINGISKFLHLMNPLRTQYITNASQGIFEKKILDIGCGAGILSESLCNAGGIVTGLDISSNMIHEARMHAKIKNLNIRYVNENVLAHIKNHIQYYDTIVCMEVLEHTRHPMEIVHICSQLIKPGGDIFFSTISRTLISFFTIIFLAEYLFRFIPIKTHSFAQFITPCELLAWLDNTGLKAQDIIGIKYNPCTRNFYLSPNVNTNYIIHARLL
ncbi:bifunctional 3-demethylubiquinone-9 3-methyltransferase/2-octaprenyl-6-hydroxy phenol methylase [Wigglesworthia glossinidia endosymbiont of Glossina morsitans morsitans (Yale colony)]|uniref:Bifunctional 3-demethylubiquinone-9 3-methyltransferase/2-octaprenyl-6-hydroxy phenol methylase n=1 Tax=Wigglesworthia glossinidia endosymbiont of Glossina morsitans morsitans (Yale colony) TaxID=1142511 RepID=H6Q5V7_WIGGL|nr:bifunctional 2-polyprenyl-6-hydroxyphenol methylase/3-demethylubiquinol 3-O-methyltransferase UbiG [Wigglesworthia glossinidia]AFA41153.1 bifunctional 3-demethylubiquinone-9 3-methyltransferase/2-octaprenyl-6-hydroxy phenol methylase [Wigglesworthia glossinidia endosymbiont of Glossina morsitans morsitans (Yale colony)]